VIDRAKKFNGGHGIGLPVRKPCNILKRGKRQGEKFGALARKTAGGEGGLKQDNERTISVEEEINCKTHSVKSRVLVWGKFMVGTSQSTTKRAKRWGGVWDLKKIHDEA